MISPRIPPARGRADRLIPPGGRPECNLGAGQHRPLAAKARDVIAENVPDQPRLVAVNFNRSGMPRLCLFVPFHSLGDSRG